MAGLRSLPAPTIVSLILILEIFANLVSSLVVESGSLRADSLVNPLGLANLTPRLSWRLQSSKRNDNQTAFQVQVASSASSLNSSDLWDTGKIASEDFFTLYAGEALDSRSIGWWRVQAWDSQDEPSGWSEPGSFEIALTKTSDWKASWIQNQNYIPEGGTSLPVFAKTFSVTSSIAKGRLYLIGLGQYSASLNGQPVSEAVLAPGYSQTNKSLPFTTFDVTTLLQSGQNILGVELGKGVYDAEPPLAGRYTDSDTTLNPLTLIAQLEVTFENGSVVIIPSDESWKTSVSGPQLESSWYGGEEYDARKEIPGWPSVTVNTSSWSNAEVINGPAVNGSLTPDPGPNLKIVDRWTAQSVTQINATTWVFDLGVNFAGWYNLTMKGEAGQRVVFWPGEYLTDRLVNQSSTGRPIFDGYTFAGRDSEWYAPRFMYHGFRYLQVDNLTNAPTASDLEALVIRADNEAVGTFSTSSSLFNSIHTIIDRAIQSNMYSVLTDCPHREKSGWLEQDHLVFDPLARAYDVEAYIRRFLATIAEGQQPDGMIPTTAPEFKVFFGGTLGIYRDEPNWGDAMILLPLYLYQTYGDGALDTLSEYYSVMTSYVSYLGTKTNGTHTLNYGLGDWIGFDAATTPVSITSTMGYFQSVAALAEIARILNKTADAQTYSAMAADIQAAFHADFFNTSTNASYASGSQACNAIALDIGAVPSTHRSAVLDSLVTSLENTPTHLTVGEIALPALVRVLASPYSSPSLSSSSSSSSSSSNSTTTNQLLYTLMSSTHNTSYGFQVTNGATSLWEDWDGVLRTTGSLNHWMLGYGDAWLVRLAGMDQELSSSSLTPGVWPPTPSISSSSTGGGGGGSIAWKQIAYRPPYDVVGMSGNGQSLTSAQAAYRTPRGWANATWELRGNGSVFAYDVVVPVGATGQVWLRGGGGDITESGTRLTEDVEGVLWIQQTGGDDDDDDATTVVVVGVGSGSYSFEIDGYEGGV